MLRAVAKLLRVLNSDADPGQISLGICFAMVAGLTPFLSLHNLIVLLLVLTLRVNLSAFLLGLALFSGIAYILDPVFHTIGLTLLTSSLFKGVWTLLYNSTIWRLEGFNNTIVAGSLAFSIILFIPLLLILNLVIRRYREHLLKWVEKTRVMKFFKATKLYRTYQSVSGWGSAA